MITIAQYMNFFRTEREKMMKSGHFKSEPTFLFRYDADLYSSEWVFNKDNWNGCDILRRFLCNNPIPPTGFEIKEYVIDDTTHFFILTPGSFYEISWYKSRGRTDYIRKDGQPIEIDEYLDICNKLGVELPAYGGEGE